MRAGAGKLTYQPAIRQMVVKHDWITASPGFAHATKTGPYGRNAPRSQNRISSGLVKDLISFIDNLHILRQAHGSVWVGWRAVTAHAWKRDAIKRPNVEQGCSVLYRRTLKHPSFARLDQSCLCAGTVPWDFHSLPGRRHV